MAKEKRFYRLFFSINLPTETKTKLLCLQQSFSDLAGVPIAENNFHITLSFLGKVTERQLEEIQDGILPVKVSPFDITLTKLIYWPKQSILALSINDPENKLTQCKKQIEQQLSRLGFFSFDKKDFVPHVTLFRQVEGVPLEQHYPELSVEVSKIDLIISEQNKNGTQYHTIEQWPLKKSLSVKQQLIGKHS